MDVLYRPDTLVPLPGVFAGDFWMTDPELSANRIIVESLRDLMTFGQEIDQQLLRDLGIELNSRILGSSEVLIAYPMHPMRLVDTTPSGPWVGSHPLAIEALNRLSSDADMVRRVMLLVSPKTWLDAMQNVTQIREEVGVGAKVSWSDPSANYPNLQMGALCTVLPITTMWSKKASVINDLFRELLDDPRVELVVVTGAVDERVVPKYNELVEAGIGTEVGGALSLGLVFSDRGAKNNNEWISTVSIPNANIPGNLTLAHDLAFNDPQYVERSMVATYEAMASFILMDTKFGFPKDQVLKVDVRESGLQELELIEPKLPADFLSNPLPGGMRMTWGDQSNNLAHIRIIDDMVVCRLRTERGSVFGWALSIEDMTDGGGNITLDSIKAATSERQQLDDQTMTMMRRMIEESMGVVMETATQSDASISQSDMVRKLSQEVGPLIIDMGAYGGVKTLDVMQDDEELIELVVEDRQVALEGLMRAMKVLLMIRTPRYWGQVMRETYPDRLNDQDPIPSIDEVLRTGRSSRLFKWGSDNIRYIYPKGVASGRRSPRYHMVRGHIKRGRDGEIKTIEPYYRGQAKLGRVHGEIAIGESKRGPWSRAALSWLASVERKLGRRIRHAKNGGEYRIPGVGRKLLVDGWDPETGTIYEFHGDYWHGNPRRYPADDPHPDVRGKTFGDLYQATLEKEQLLRDLGYDLVVMWEMDWDQRS